MSEMTPGWSNVKGDKNAPEDTYPDVEPFVESDPGYSNTKVVSAGSTESKTVSPKKTTAKKSSK